MSNLDEYSPETREIIECIRLKGYFGVTCLYEESGLYCCVLFGGNYCPKVGSLAPSIKRELEEVRKLLKNNYKQ